MKSVLQAGWLLTVAVGNIIVLIVAEAAKLPDQVGGFFISPALGKVHSMPSRVPVVYV